MKKWTMWAAVALGALGIAFLSGAFEKFFNWDRDETSIASGLFTAGVAVAGAYLAHSTGIIDGNTRNLLITAGIAVGAYNSIGTKAYDWGKELAMKVSKKGGNTGRSNAGQSSSFDGGGEQNADFFSADDGISNLAAQPGFGGGNPASGFAPPAGMSPGATSPSGGQAPVYNINVEAAKIPKPNVGLELGKTAIDSGFAALGQIFGSKGGQQRELSSANI